MNDQEFQEAKIRQIKATALKEEAEAEKIKHELAQAKTELESPFYKQSWFTKSLVAGILLFSFLIGYVEIVFRPAQEKMQNETDTVKYKLERKEAQFAAEKARLQFLLDRTTFEGKKAEATLLSASSQLNKAEESIRTLETTIRDIKESDCDSDKIAATELNIEKEINEIKEVKKQSEYGVATLQAIKEEMKEVVTESSDIQGWIYVGHYPNNKWGYKNIETDANKLPKLSEKYLLLRDLNVRSQSPKFTFTGYDFGRIVGHLLAGQTVEVIGEPREVGFSKVWVEVKLTKD